MIDINGKVFSSKNNAVNNHPHHITDNRESWESYFMHIAFSVARRSTCLRRQVGCICVDDNRRILSTGYNGAPKGLKHCIERGGCVREHVDSGLNLQECYAVHAEMNAIVQAASSGANLTGSTMYCTTYPCIHCTKLIINTGIAKIYFVEAYPSEFSKKLLTEAGISIIQLKEINNIYVLN